MSARSWLAGLTLVVLLAALLSSNAGRQLCGAIFVLCVITLARGGDR